MLEVTTHDGVPAGEIRAAWDRLVDADPHATVFHMPGFLATWHRELGTGVRARVRAVRRDHDLVGVVAEQVGSDSGVLRFLGGTEVTDYLGPVARPQAREEVAAAWIRAIAADPGWERAELGGLAEDSGWHGLIAHQAKLAGLAVGDGGVDDVCPRIDLSRGLDAHLDGLASKQRSELRRKVRRLVRAVGEIELVEAEPGELDAALGRLFDLAEAAGGDKGRFFVDERMRGFFTALAAELGPAGTLRVHTLRAGGLPAAVAVSLVHNREWGVYNTAFDQTLADLSPGMVLITQLLRTAAGEGATVFDLLRGDEAYKYRFGAADRTLHRLTLTRR